MTDRRLHVQSTACPADVIPGLSGHESTAPNCIGFSLRLESGKVATCHIHQRDEGSNKHRN